MNEIPKEEPQSCMNCENRTNGNECVIKKVFAQNFQNCGSKYKRSIYIVESDSNDCTYWKQSNHTTK